MCDSVFVIVCVCVCDIVGLSVCVSVCVSVWVFVIKWHGGRCVLKCVVYSGSKTMTRICRRGHHNDINEQTHTHKHRHSFFL